MLAFITIVLGIALLLYTLLGGADYGAGMIETFSGKKGVNTISQAIAPVWEANHIWLILAVVILFNGFPDVYATLSIYLHIPFMVVLTGIIIRGTAFTFRYYDVKNGGAGEVYTRFFRTASFLTPFFLGISLGALSVGYIPARGAEITFYEGYIHPWLNLYSIAMGFFTIFIFGTLAGVYLIGEAKDDAEKGFFIKISRVLFALLIISGGLVFFTAEINGIPLFSSYFGNWFSLASIIIATLTIPVTFMAIMRAKVVLSRLAVGFQVVLIFLGYVATSFPVIVKIQGAEPLTFFNAIAPPATQKQLTIALIFGVLIIIPAIIFLFKVFKYDKEKAY